MNIYNRRSARRALIDTAAIRALSQVATVLSFIVLVRSMPDTDFGIFNLFYAVIPLVSTVASLGLEQSLRRYQPEYLSAGNLAAARWLVRFVARSRFLVNVVVLLLIVLAWNSLAPLFKLQPYRDQFLIFVVLILLHFQARILQLSLASNMLHRFSVGALALLSFVKLVIYLALAQHEQLTLTYGIVADTCANAVTYAFLVLTYRRHCRTPELKAKYRPDSAERKRMFRYSALNNFNDAGAFMLGTKSDAFFIAAIMDPAAVAVFAFYTRLNEMVLRLIPSRLFDNVVQPLIFAIPRAQAPDKIPRYFSLLLNAGLALQLPALTYAAVFHNEIVTVIFGKNFASHSYLMPIVMAFGLLDGFSKPITLVAQYEEKAGVILLSKIFVFYNVAAFFAFIPLWGVGGAVFATGSATVFKNLFVWWQVRNQAIWLSARRTILWGLTYWLVVLVICMLISRATKWPAVLDLLSGAGVCGVAALFYLRGVGLSTTDRQVLGGLLTGRERRLLHLVGIQPNRKEGTQR